MKLLDRIKEELSAGATMEEYADAVDALRQGLATESSKTRQMLLGELRNPPAIHSIWAAHSWTVTEFPPEISDQDIVWNIRVIVHVPYGSPVEDPVLRAQYTLDLRQVKELHHRGHDEFVRRIEHERKRTLMMLGVHPGTLNHDELVPAIGPNGPISTWRQNRHYGNRRLGP